MSDESSIILVIGILISYLAIVITINIMFIISQNKLIDVLEARERRGILDKAWTWTQLIPLWGVVATFISLQKLEETISEIRERDSIYIKYNHNYPVIYLISAILTYMIGVVWIVSVIILLLTWIEINQTRKSLEVYED